MSVDPALPDANGTRPDEHRYTVVPSALVRDPNLSTTAKAVYLALDDRQGNRRDVHANRTTLAADLGVSVATIKRAVAELIDSGWIAREQSRYTNRYATRNPARTRRQLGHLRPVSTPSRVTDEPSAGSPMTHVSNIPLGIEKQASNSGDREPRTNETAAAAGASRPAEAGSPPPVIDQGLSDYIAAFHKVCHIDLARTRRVAAALTRARGNGWTASDLAAALRDKPRSPNAGTGVVVLDLETLADNLPNLVELSGQMREYPLVQVDDLITWAQRYPMLKLKGTTTIKLPSDQLHLFAACDEHGYSSIVKCPMCRVDRTQAITQHIDDYITNNQLQETPTDVYINAHTYTSGDCVCYCKSCDMPSDKCSECKNSERCYHGCMTCTSNKCDVREYKHEVNAYVQNIYSKPNIPFISQVSQYAALISMPRQNDPDEDMKLRAAFDEVALPGGMTDDELNGRVPISRERGTVSLTDDAVQMMVWSDCDTYAEILADAIELRNEILQHLSASEPVKVSTPR